MTERSAGPESKEILGSGLRAELAREEKVYALFDGAANTRLLDYLYRLQPPFECLYRGELQPDMAYTAPYLALLEPDSEFGVWAIEQGFGKHWGVFAVSDSDLPAVRRHFRHFLIVHTEEGKPLYFRFYDPRVLRVYLPTCNEKELAEFFGPVKAFLMEGESPEEFVRFENANGKLKQSAMPARSESKWASQRPE